MPSHHHDVERRLSDSGHRFTPGRRALIDALASSAGPRSAAELQRTLSGRVPLSSLYRSLTVLEECGVVVPHHGQRGVTRYELAEWLSGHHHHLVCVECGRVDDVALPATAEREMETIAASVGRTADFVAVGHTLEIEGRCGGCR